VKSLLDPFAKPPPPSAAAPAAPPAPAPPPKPARASGPASKSTSPERPPPPPPVSDNWEEEGAVSPGLLGGGVEAGPGGKDAQDGIKIYSRDFMKTLGAKPQCLARPDFHKDFASCQACVIEVIRKEPLPFSATDSLGVGGALRMHGPRMGLPPGMGPAGPGAMGGPSGGGGPQWGDRRQAGPMDPRFQDARGGRGGVTGPPGPGARGTVGTRGGGMDDKQWERRGPGAAGGMAAGGRGGPGGRGGGIGSLHRAESRFVIGAVRGDDPVEEKKQKEILATLNKVTPNTLEKLTDHVGGGGALGGARIINDVKLEDQVTLEGLIDKIFDKALTDTHFSEMYSTMCHRVSVNEKTPKFPNPDGGKDIDFRRLLLNKCQVEFEQGCQAMDSVSTQEKEQGLAAGAALPAEEGEADKAVEGKEEGELPQPAVEAKPLTANQLLQQNRAARRRMLGNILFVGNLFKISLITERFSHKWGKDPQDPQNLMQEVALTANKITAMYSGPSPFSALDFVELTAFTNVAGPGSCLVYNGSGHLALQPHGSGSMTVQSDEADSEDEEEVGSRQAAADMETTFGENEEEEEGSELGSEPVQLYAIAPKGRRAALVPASDFQQHVDSAKQELAATADAVVRDLHSRFLPPEHAKGLAVVYAHYGDKQPSGEDFLERLAIVKARYCMDATLADGQLAPALLDQQKLSAQQSAFVKVMRCQAEHRVQLSSSAANPAKETTKLWRYLAGQPITKADILEYIKLAELALVMTPGSVEEERMFSAMAYLKDDTRNRLQECPLNVCARVFSSNQFDLDTFPDERAISKWLDWANCFDLMFLFILHSCIVQLLKEEASPRADDIECLCKLLVTVGHKLDSTNKPEHKQAMFAYFERMKRLAVSPTLDSRIRFTIKDVLEMRENNWVARRKAEGPKKIEDLHREATAELEAQARRDEQERRNARGGGGGYRGDDRRGGGGPPMRGGPPPTRNDDYSRLVAKDEMPRQAMSLSANRQSSTEISLRPQASNSRGAVMGGRTASSALSSAAAARGAGAQDVRVSADPPPPPRSAPHASEARAPAPPPPQALPRMAPADLVTPAKSLVEEYFVNRSTSEAILSMADLRKRGADMAALLYPVLVAALNVRGLGLEERVAPLRELFMAALKEANGGVSSEEFVAGVRLVGCELHRLVEDLPKAPMVLSQFFGEFVADGVLPLAAVLQPVLDVPPSEDDGGTNPPLVDVGAAPDLLLGVMAKIKERLGEASAVSQWTSSGLDALLFWPDFERDNLGRIRAAVGKMGLDFLVAP
ncbi:hypothetical protein QJQ45_021731, partial [Haematococcus lacustris]